MVWTSLETTTHRCDFYYVVLVQDKAGGQVITVQDNRAALAANRITAGNAEGREALNKLLTGGK